MFAAAGQEILGLEPGAALVGRCDSFVVETDVHYPTDVGLLRDSVRCLIREASRACGAFGVSGWRQRRHWEGTVGALFNAVRTASLQRSRPGAVRSYLAASLKLAAKAEGSLAALKRAGCPESALGEIARLVAHVRRFADQIERRVLRGEKILHGEKLFSIFEEHTRWISKGKAGKKVEFGVPVCIVEDGNGFALGHEILWTGGDADVAVPLVRRCREAFPGLRGCSFDRGFHSPSNREELDKLLDLERLAEEGQAVGRRARARGGAGLRGGPAQAFGSGVGDQQPGAPGAGPGPAARPGRVRAGGRPLRPRLQRPPDRADPARARAQADAAGTQANAAGTRTGAGRAQAGAVGTQADAAGMRATAAANPTTARRLSGASPGNRTAGRRPTAEPAPTARKPRKTRNFGPGAEPALLPREKALRKPPGKPVVRENWRLFCQTRVKRIPATKYCVSRVVGDEMLAWKRRKMASNCYPITSVSTARPSHAALAHPPLLVCPNELWSDNL